MEKHSLIGLLIIFIGIILYKLSGKIRLTIHDDVYIAVISYVGTAIIISIGVILFSISFFG